MSKGKYSDNLMDLVRGGKEDKGSEPKEPPKKGEKDLKAYTNLKKEEESNEKTKEEVAKPHTQSFKFKINPQKKESRSVKKCFLTTPSLNEKFSSMAKEYGLSENELFNTILKQVFEEE